MITRRRLLQYGALSGTAGLFVVTPQGCQRSPPPDQPRRLAFFTFAEFATIEAVCERILPRDEDPGAIDLGVPAYIDRALAGDDYRRQRERFRSGLRALDLEAAKLARKPFAHAGGAQQDNIIDDWQNGTDDQVEFLRLLVRLTLEGAFGDPSYGGNRDGQGWRLVGFEPCEPHRHLPG
jgi:gluconate 2-dehydrogenase gamma chain